MTEQEARTRATAVYDALVHRGRIDREAVIAAFAAAILAAASEHIPESAFQSVANPR